MRAHRKLQGPRVRVPCRLLKGITRMLHITKNIVMSRMGSHHRRRREPRREVKRKSRRVPREQSHQDMEEVEVTPWPHHRLLIVVHGVIQAGQPIGGRGRSLELSACGRRVWLIGRMLQRNAMRQITSRGLLLSGD